MTSQADAILDAKLALEAELAQPLLVQCTRYVEAWVEAGGQMPAIDRVAWLSSIEKLLRRHYARTAMAMTGRRPPMDAKLHVAAQSMRQMESLISRAKEQSRLILASIDRDLARGMLDGEKSAGGDIEVKDNQPPPGRITAGYMAKLKAAAVSTLQKLKSKIKTISNVNTQGPAEEARTIEVVPDDQANGRLLSVWNSLLDGRERDTHHEAHGQERWVGDPFEVGGALLRFPGDTSLGAPLKEVANCRCFIQTWWVSNETGERTLIHTGTSAPTRRFRQPRDKKPPSLSPTSKITLNGRTNARVVLGDGETLATMRQPSPNKLEVLVDRRVVGRADIVNGKPVNVTVDPKLGNLDIDGLMRRTIEHNAQRR